MEIDALLNKGLSSFDQEGIDHLLNICKNILIKFLKKYKYLKGKIIIKLNN